MLSASGFPSRYWLTYAQAQKLGGNVRKGERGSIVMFWNIGEERINAKTGKLSKPFLLRYYRVFNLSQTEGIAHKLGIAEASAKPVADIDACERIVAEMPNAPADFSQRRPCVVSAICGSRRNACQVHVPFQRVLLLRAVPRIDAQHGPCFKHWPRRNRTTEFLRERIVFARGTGGGDGQRDAVRSHWNCSCCYREFSGIPALLDHVR